MLRVARFPFHRPTQSHRYWLKRKGVYNPHFAGNAHSKQVRRDGHTIGLEKVNSRLTYSSKEDVLQVAKTEMLSPAKVDIPLLVESYILL
jgi:hypothetical protein